MITFEGRDDHVCRHRVEREIQTADVAPIRVARPQGSAYRIASYFGLARGTPHGHRGADGAGNPSDRDERAAYRGSSRRIADSPSPTSCPTEATVGEPDQARREHDDGQRPITYA